ncbi:MAG TPA: hypothetical protein VMZ91_11580 [Candidatus Paceibacterota bacterium]|nr:hypothetical protein [Candidatus Paceibacterota bacterium]
MPCDKTRRSSKRFKIKENKKYPYRNKRLKLWQRKSQKEREKESS